MECSVCFFATHKARTTGALITLCREDHSADHYMYILSSSTDCRTVLCNGFLNKPYWSDTPKTHLLRN